MAVCVGEELRQLGIVPVHFPAWDVAGEAGLRIWLK
jgi:hypothetical protein